MSVTLTARSGSVHITRTIYGDVSGDQILREQVDLEHRADQLDIRPRAKVTITYTHRDDYSTEPEDV